MEDISKERSTIGQDFTLWTILKFTFPSILTALFTQLFRSLDDGLFVSRYVGEIALASIKLLNPMNAITIAITNLFSVGGSTLSAHTMGAGDKMEAKRIFTRITLASGLFGLIFAVLTNVFCDPMLYFLGAAEDTIDNARLYVRIVYTCFPINIMSTVMSSYYSTAGKPQMGLVNSILNGAVNIILDIILIPVMKLGVVGSCLSTVLGDAACLLLGLVFYSMPKHDISFASPKNNFVKTTLKCWSAGLSQCFNSICFAITTYVTNQILLSLASSNGVAANAVISDLRTIVNASFVGFATCIAPVIAYNYGAKNPVKLKKTLSFYLELWFLGSILITTVGELLRKPLISLFIPDPSTSQIYDMTFEGLTIEYAGTAFMAGCILIMRMFTALGNTKATSVVSAMRNFVFRIPLYLLLPKFWGLTGLWLAFPAAELISFIFGMIIVYINRDNYGYGRSGKALKLMNYQ